MVEDHINEFKRLSNEYSGYKKEIKKMYSKIEKLGEERERYGVEQKHAEARWKQCQEDIKLKNSLMDELHRKNVEADAKLKQQQNLYEAVRSDRNLYSKNLIESHDEIEELKKKRKIMQH